VEGARKPAHEPEQTPSLDPTQQIFAVGNMPVLSIDICLKLP
jgi:hypothetical protein